MNATHHYDANSAIADSPIPDSVAFIFAIVGIFFFCGCLWQMRGGNYTELGAHEHSMVALRAGPSMDELQDFQQTQTPNDSVSGLMAKKTTADHEI
jgi:hypothetical protein